MYIQVSRESKKIRKVSRPRERETYAEWLDRICMQLICLCGNRKATWILLCPSCRVKHIKYLKAHRELHGAKYIYDRIKDVYSID